MNGADMSRSASAPDSASLGKTSAVNLAEKAKPATKGEVMSECSRWAFRGGWGQGVSKDQSRNPFGFAQGRLWEILRDG